MQKRYHSEKYRILEEENFDPYSDLIPDENGVYQFTPAKPNLVTRLQEYFEMRDEDSKDEMNDHKRYRPRKVLDKQIESHWKAHIKKQLES